MTRETGNDPCRRARPDEPSCRARPDSQGTLPGGIFWPSLSYLANDDSGQGEIRDSKGKAKPCGPLGAIEKHAALVMKASQVPIPEHDNDLVPSWADAEDSGSDVTDVCGTPVSGASVCNEPAVGRYNAQRDPESPEYVNSYPSQWRKVTARETWKPHDVQSRRTGTRWRPLGVNSGGPVGDVEALNFFRGPPVPV